MDTSILQDLHLPDVCKVKRRISGAQKSIGLARISNLMQIRSPDQVLRSVIWRRQRLKLYLTCRKKVYIWRNYFFLNISSYVWLYIASKMNSIFRLKNTPSAIQFLFRKSRSTCRKSCSIVKNAVFGRRYWRTEPACWADRITINI